MIAKESTVFACSGGNSKRWRGSRPGGRGGGSCFDETTIIWTKNATQSDKNAKQVMAKHIIEGDLVGTIDLKTHSNGDRILTWTRATDVTISSGNWESYSFTFASHHRLTVTSPHLMIVWKDGMSYFIRADKVMVGDEMIVNKTTSYVTRIKHNMITTKVAIETEDATIQANGVLASGLCDDNPEVIDKMVQSDPMIASYKSSHFGDDYKSMCMDSVAWKHAYMINNGF